MDDKPHWVLIFLALVFWAAWLALTAGVLLGLVENMLFAAVAWVVLLLLGILLLTPFLPKKKVTVDE
jgi:hypothetical protein